MSNEDKIISLLTSIQKDVETMKVDIDEIKNNGFYQQQEMNELKEARIKRQLEALNTLSNLLNDEEKEAFGKFMDAEEERKFAAYV